MEWRYIPLTINSRFQIPVKLSKARIRLADSLSLLLLMVLYFTGTCEVIEEFMGKRSRS
jgi:hypothetical protein